MFNVTKISFFLIFTTTIQCLDDCNKNYFKNAITSYGKRKGYDEYRIFLEEEISTVYSMKVTGENIKHLCRNEIPEAILKADLQNIGLSYIEVNFLQNTTLRMLNLSFNSIFKVRNNVFSDSKLVLLDLSHNIVEILEGKAFENMPFLEGIILDYNRISKWDSNWFKNTNLHLVSLKNNIIAELPRNATQNLKGHTDKYLYILLLKIYLDNNRIKYIHPEAFTNLNKMGIISLTYNKLFELSSKTFESVYSIGYMDVSHNNFICFSSQSLTTFNNVRTLVIANNRLNDECRKQMMRFFENKMDVIIF
ncbi:unnamed protein product [Brassicogethes aeneus]|uniref:Uncharacterized protein n=1 Tax=Brassicogethes aeneus TaxID=1431903 RepID=A0A9P0ATS1_BRAAE|nr:unnamed protein product [Brassicogethes aeneus]